MTNRVRLGIVKRDLQSVGSGETIYISKHSWDCGWYWSFGYLSNKNCHFHLNSLWSVNNQLLMSADIFSDTNITEKEWWVIRDLYMQAYALKEAAAVYQYGGHQTCLTGVTDMLKNQAMADQLNKDLEKLLDTAWDFVCKAVEPKFIEQDEACVS